MAASCVQMQHLNSVTHIYHTNNFNNFMQVALLVANQGLELEVWVTQQNPETSLGTCWEQREIYTLDNESVLQCAGQVDAIGRRCLLAKKKTNSSVASEGVSCILEEAMMQNELWVGRPCTEASHIAKGDFIEVVESGNVLVSQDEIDQA